MQFPAPPALEHSELTEYRDQFPILQKKTYLNSGSLGALSERSMQNMTRFMTTWNEWGAHAWDNIWLDEVDRARRTFATLIGAQPHEIAIAPNVSTALSSIASAFDYSERNNVVMSDMDFPTLTYQWLVKQRLGVECRFAHSTDHIYISPAAFAPLVDDRTALVATSRVCDTSGYIQDIRAIADIAHKHEAYLLVDDYQGTGQIPLDVNALDIDVLVTGSLKWLLGGPGLAFIYVREGLIPLVQPTIAGWFGERDQFQFKNETFEFRPNTSRLEMGTPAMAAVYSALGGLDMIQEVSVQSICERSRYLTNDLIARAREHGWIVCAPQEPELRGSLVVLELPGAPTIVRELLSRNIIVDHRPGSVRISPNFYNTIEENAIVIDAITEILEKRRA
jgi:kynureninase